MKNQLTRQESVLPPGYRLQVIKNEDGFLQTVPLGTNSNVMYGQGIQFRNRIADELTKLFIDEYGFTLTEVMTICADVDGNECVWCKAKVHPRPKMDRTLPPKPTILALPEQIDGDDIIDI